ncbi:MAG: LuxR C-terminal-related transcriptional regulator [Actinomycetota bacterium]
MLRHLVDGEPASAIAERAGVSEATVRSQIRAVLTKLGVRSQLAAAAFAVRAGWARPDTRAGPARPQGTGPASPQGTGLDTGSA